MFNYSFNPNENFKINTPFCTNIKEIDYKVISHTANEIHSISTYSNGFIYESIYSTDKILISTNKPLIQNADGSFDVKL